MTIGVGLLGVQHTLGGEIMEVRLVNRVNFFGLGRASKPWVPEFTDILGRTLMPGD